MEYFGSSSSGSKKSGTPFLSGMPLSIIRPACRNSCARDSEPCDKITLEFVDRKAQKFARKFLEHQNASEIMRKWQEKLIIALEKEFFIYNYENGKAREQLKLSVLQRQQNKSKRDEDIAMKQLAERVNKMSMILKDKGKETIESVIGMTKGKEVMKA
ncbi:unnamed protein product [Prunus armeniaca]